MNGTIVCLWFQMNYIVNSPIYFPQRYNLNHLNHKNKHNNFLYQIKNVSVLPQRQRDTPCNATSGKVYRPLFYYLLSFFLLVEPSLKHVIGKKKRSNMNTYISLSLGNMHIVFASILLMKSMKMQIIYNLCICIFFSFFMWGSRTIIIIILAFFVVDVLVKKWLASVCKAL